MKSVPPALEKSGALGASVLDGDLLFPVAILRESAIAGNRSWMQSFLAATGASIAPHGKTSMSPELFAMQLADGAWGLTAATAHHVRVYHRLGLRRILLANQLVGKANIALVLDLLAADPGLVFLALVDSVPNVEALSAAHSARPGLPPLRLLVEVGALGGRTGVRRVSEGLEVARSVAGAPGLELAGVETFEGVFQGQEGAAEQIEAMLDDLLALATAADAEGLFGGDQIILTGGGSAYFDRCVRRFAASSLSKPVHSIIRSGCYISHDDGLYRRMFAELTARDGQAAAVKPGLEPALEVWAPVQSLPEPGRVIAALGKRDAGYDAGLPVAKWMFRPGRDSAPVPLDDRLMTTGLFDQHAILDGPHDLAVGDLIGFGISHPCTTFDRWRMLFLVDDQRRVTGHVTTLF